MMPVRRVVTAAGAISSALIYSALMFPVLWSAQPGPFQALRTFASHDQLGYLSIVADVASGDLANSEPVTQTGVNHYPRVYYTMVGLVAGAFRLEPVTAWNIVSVTLQLAAVVAIALCIARVSRRSWAAFLAPLPFFAGVMAFAAGNGDGWFRALDSHAVLWGPYGVLFPSNAETAGLSIIVIAVSALASVWLRETSRKWRLAVTVIAAAALGALSGFQTYSFLTGAYVVLYVVAVRFLTLPARRWWLVATAGAVVALFALGPLVSAALGQLPTLVFGLLPAIPGAVRGAIRSRGKLVVFALVFAVAAAPQILWTASGILGDDPFLSYRVASNVDLGVIRVGAVIAASAVAVPLLSVTVISFLRRRWDAMAVSVGILAAWIVLAVNDVWGANAEPYRFWIDGFMLGGVFAMISAAALFRRERPDTVRHRRRWPVVLTVAVCAVIYAVSLIDFVRFQTDPGMNATWNPNSPRETAIAELAADAGASDDGLLVTDNCIDMRTTKVTSAAPMAFYYLGMAWPEDRDAVQDVMDAQAAGYAIPTSSADAASVRWILRDSACNVNVSIEGEQLEFVAAYDYSATDRVELWRRP